MTPCRSLARAAAWTRLVVAAAMVWSSGCLVVTLAPVYDEKVLEFDPSLLGVWENQEDRVSIEVEKREWRSYAIVWRDGFGTQEFTAHLTRVGKDRLIDVAPAAGVDQGALLIPAHGFCRITQDGDTLFVEPLDYDWLRHPAQRWLLPGNQSVTDERQNLVLVGSTLTLRSWILRNAGRPRLFGPPATFVRKRPASL